MCFSIQQDPFDPSLKKFNYNGNIYEFYLGMSRKRKRVNINLWPISLFFILINLIEINRCPLICVVTVYNNKTYIRKMERKKNCGFCCKHKFIQLAWRARSLQGSTDCQKKSIKRRPIKWGWESEILYRLGKFQLSTAKERIITAQIVRPSV